uniref:Uncharacterized protein n=1 Tax=Anopheles melas TaxID=34690 RepID=A0A182TYW4_9DIPT
MNRLLVENRVRWHQVGRVVRSTSLYEKEAALMSDSGSEPVPILVVADRCAAIVPLVGVRLPPHLSPSRSEPDRICPMVACVLDDGKISDGSSGTDTPRRISLEVFISSFASWRSSGVTALTVFTSRRKSSFSSAQAATLTSLLSRACSSRCFSSRSRPISSLRLLGLQIELEIETGARHCRMHLYNANKK